MGALSERSRFAKTSFATPARIIVLFSLSCTESEPVSLPGVLLEGTVGKEQVCKDIICYARPNNISFQFILYRIRTCLPTRCVTGRHCRKGAGLQRHHLLRPPE